MVRILIAAVASVLILSPGDRADTLSLEEAVSAAVEDNLNVRAAEERLHEIHGQIREARSRAYPQININGTYSRFRDPGILNSSSFEDFRDLDVSGFSLIPEPEKRYEAGINLEQSLFTWGRIPGAIRAAKSYRDQAGGDLEAARLEIAYRTAETYYYLNLVKSEIRLLEKAEETYRENLEVAENKIAVGDATRLDMLRARVALANVGPGLIEKRKEEYLAKARLNILMNRDIEAPVTVDEITPEIADGNIPEPDALNTAAFRNNPRLSALESEKEALRSTADVYRSEMRPSVAFSGNYGRSVSDYDDITDPLYESWSVALVLNVPIFNGFRTSGRLMQIRSQEKSVEYEIDFLKKQIKLDVLDARSSMIKSLKQMETAEIGLDQAEEALSIIKQRYALGLSSTFELLDTEREKRQAEVNCRRAKYDYLTALARLKWTLGLTPLESLEGLQK